MPRKLPDVHPSNPNWVMRKVLDKWLDLEQARVNELERNGVVHRAPLPYYYLLQESVTSVIKRLRTENAGRRSQDGQHDVMAESAQLKRAQRERINIQMQRERGELVPAHEVVRVYGEIVADVRTAMLGLPARIQGELPHMVTSEVDAVKKIVRETLAELTQLGNQPPRIGDHDGSQIPDRM